MAEYEKRGYLLENFRLFHLQSPTGTSVDYHYHEFCKLLLLVSGRGGYVVEGQRYLLQPGDVVLIGSRCAHKPELESDIPYERVIIYIDPDFLQISADAECNLLDLFSGNRGHVLRLRESERKKIFSLSSALEKELNGEEYGRQILSNGTLLRLLVEIGREQARDLQDRPLAQEPKDPRVLQLMAYIRAHIAEELTVDRLAEQCYLSKYHLMRLFRAETGQSVYGWLTQQRLLMARELMADGVRATEAAYRSGFDTYSCFTRAYSKQFGTTPTGRSRTATRQEETYE